MDSSFESNVNMDPLKYYFSHEQWQSWKNSFENFLHYEGIDENEVKFSVLMNCLGDEGSDIFHFFESYQKETFGAVMTAFDAYFSNEKYVIEETSKFREMLQEEDESIDDFFRRIERQADLCDFQAENVKARMLRDQLVLGICDQDTRNRLKKLKNPKTDDILEYCRRMEASRRSLLMVKIEEIDVDTKENIRLFDETLDDEFDLDDEKPYMYYG